MVPVRVDLGTAPITVSSFWPPLKIITVGMERMPYSVAMLGDSSVLSFTCFDAGASGIRRRSSARSDAKRASDRATEGGWRGFPPRLDSHDARGTGTRGSPGGGDEPRERAR